MKKFLLCMIAFMLMVVLSGCTKDVELRSEMEKDPNVEPLSGEEISKNMISSNLLGQTVYDTLQAEWDAWNTKTEEQKMFSSHMPGHCYVNFDTWEECEAFLGFEVFQPLEDSDFEKGNYVGMPEGYNDSSHIHVSFFGTNEGKVEWIQLECGYRNGDVRITVTAHINVDIPRTEEDVSIPKEENGERYVAVTSTLAKGPVAYTIRIVGESALRTQVKETMEQVLPYFTENLK